MPICLRSDGRGQGSKTPLPQLDVKDLQEKCKDERGDLDSVVSGNGEKEEIDEGKETRKS